MKGLGALLIAASLISLAACIVPPPFEETPDSGTNQPPQILWKHTDPPKGELLIVAQSADPKQSEAKDFFVTVRDPDSPVITMRAFLNEQYDKPLPLSIDQIPGKGDFGRGFSITGLCDHLVNRELGMHNLQLYVSDGGFVSSGSDLRQPTPGALRDDISWRLMCIEPTGGDGGL